MELNEGFIKHYELLKELQVIEKIETLEEENQQLKKLLEIGENFSLKLSVKEIINSILHSLLDLFPLNSISIAYPIDVFNNEFEIRVFKGLKEVGTEKRITFKNTEAIIQQISSFDKSFLLYEFYKKYNLAKSNTKLNAIAPDLICPMKTNDVFNGFIALNKKISGIEFTEQDKFCIDIISCFASIAFENYKIRKLTTYDKITKLFTFSYLKNLMEIEVNRAKRYGNHLSLLILSIDKFTKISERYDTKTTETILKYIGKILKQNTRNVDMPARFGNEDFAILMPMTNGGGARNVAERIRKKVEKISFKYKNNRFQIKTSIGISSVNREIDTAEKLTSQANSALEKAKETGGNITIVLTEDFI